jgi:UDP-glucose 4-epimerase
MTTVLIVGVAGPWGASVARHLAGRSDLRVLGSGARPSDHMPAGVEPLPQPPNGRALAEVLRREQVDIVLQLDWLGEFEHVDGETAKLANVLGTMELLGACLHANTPRLLVRSTTLIYGPALKNPAFIPEQHAPARHLQTRWLRDLAEAEGMLASFAARHPRPHIGVLRAAPTMGGGLRSVFGEYLLEPNRQQMRGFDPRIQLLHGHDALAAIAYALDHPLEGAVNIAASDVFPLSVALRRVAPPEPLTLDALGRALFRPRPAKPNFDLDYLRYSCVADTTRMSAEWGFVPQQTAAAALAAALHERAVLQTDGTLAAAVPASGGRDE